MAETRNKSFCSVPGCSCSAQKQPYLSFHSFPVDSDLRQRWIRWEEGLNFVIKKGSTHVCSLHFTSEDYISGCSVSRLIPGAVPSLFPWNNFTSHPKRESVYERSNKRLSVLSVTCQNYDTATKVAKLDHDYATPPPPGNPQKQTKYQNVYFSLPNCYMVLSEGNNGATFFSNE